MSESVEIVASFPLPPKQFYENLTEDEIIKMDPPRINEEKGLSVFGSDHVQKTMKTFPLSLYFLGLELKNSWKREFNVN